MPLVRLKIIAGHTCRLQLVQHACWTAAQFHGIRLPADLHLDISRRAPVGQQDQTQWETYASCMAFKLRDTQATNKQ